MVGFNFSGGKNIFAVLVNLNVYLKELTTREETL
jgi:hypothetical protein